MGRTSLWDCRKCGVMQGQERGSSSRGNVWRLCSAETHRGGSRTGREKQDGKDDGVEEVRGEMHGEDAVERLEGRRAEYEVVLLQRKAI